MKRALLLGFALLLAGVAVAQDSAPKADVFGGYSYFRLNPGSGIDSQSMNGWEAALTGNFNRYLGITADFSGNYASPSITSLTGITIPVVGASVNLRNYLFLFGPAVQFRSRKATPFAHALFGVGHGSIGGTVAGISLSTIGLSTTDNAWAMALGGGLDYNLTNTFAIRVAQIDYVRTNYNFVVNDHQNNFRYSAGIVLRLGAK